MLILILSFVLSYCAGAPKITPSYRNGVYIHSASSILVVPEKIDNRNDLILPDALSTELLNMGLDVIDRTALVQMAKEKGLDFTEIIKGKEYSKIWALAEIKYIAIVNSRFIGSGVSNASVRIVTTKTGSLIFSATYSQPVPEQPMYIHHDTVLKTASRIAMKIKVIVL
jgi:hypothetical protein